MLYDFFPDGVITDQKEYRDTYRVTHKTQYDARVADEGMWIDVQTTSMMRAKYMADRTYGWKPTEVKVRLIEISHMSPEPRKSRLRAWLNLWG